MGKDVIVWITARDGSIHATQPPISAAGQTMLCGRSYDRLDLRIRLQGAVGHGPPGACTVCRDRMPVEVSTVAAIAPLRGPPPVLDAEPEPELEGERPRGS